MLLSDSLKLFVFNQLVYLLGWLRSMGVGCTRASEWQEAGWEGEEEKVPGGKEDGGEGEERKCVRQESWMQMGIYSLCARRQDGNEWASVTSISVDTNTHTHSETLPSFSSPMLIHASLETAAVLRITGINISTHKQPPTKYKHEHTHTHSDTQIRVSLLSWLMMSGSHFCHSYKKENLSYATHSFFLLFRSFTWVKNCPLI